MQTSDLANVGPCKRRTLQTSDLDNVRSSSTFNQLHPRGSFLFFDKTKFRDSPMKNNFFSSPNGRIRNGELKSVEMFKIPVYFGGN